MSDQKTLFQTEEKLYVEKDGFIGIDEKPYRIISVVSRVDTKAKKTEAIVTVRPFFRE